MSNPEADVITYVNSDPVLVEAGWHAYAEVPETVPSDPARLVTVERTSGNRTRFMDRAVLAVQVWAADRWEASQGASLVAERLDDMALLPHVAAVQTTTVYNFPTPEGHARYQLLVNVAVMTSG